MYDNYFPCTAVYRDDSVLIKDLVKSINGEYSAVICYSILAEKAPTAEIRKQIEHIREEEVRHLHAFSSLYASITGKHLTPKQTEHCPRSYKDGLKAAFFDEQRTADFYLHAADRSSNLEAKQLFARTAQDEQRHAVWFLYDMIHLPCHHHHPAGLTSNSPGKG
ncbi:ferritin-like domain-containing protein [Bacillus sp. YC2]|uniref:ferritin family protein n=1 Tax=Bacillus sp. YC2 TaxID=2861287 RepID=UPI001CA74B2F|nr:ferritin-like domain-containing protein [Bacillus sp. YC2]MBY8912561.1 ferritin-like domain-containing protein [Bacillus sp. YC2]